jgi:release factor glutamine methyltransferase
MIYQPAEDSHLLAEQVALFSPNKSILDMGSGTGIQALAALKAGAKTVVATDINPEAEKEIAQHNIKFTLSDLFDNISGSFDLIIFNPPYLPEDPREPQDSKTETTGGKKGDEIILKFLKQAPKHLNPNGKILLLLSSLTPQDKIDKLPYTKKLLSTKKLFMEQLEVWLLQKQGGRI